MNPDPPVIKTLLIMMRYVDGDDLVQKAEVSITIKSTEFKEHPIHGWAMNSGC